MIAMILAANPDPTYLIIGGGALALILFGVIVIAKYVMVGNPSEMLVISGRKSGDQGYRTLIGGYTIVIPLIEKVARLSLKNMQVALEVRAQAGGGTMIPVTVTGVANVKVSSDPDTRGNAIERFLDQPLDEMRRVSRETLEGGLRAVIGKMTPEEIVEDRDLFVATVMKEVTDDFRKLGLVIDSVNIQNVHDEEQYLESIARKASANVRAQARQYEAERKAEADVKEAEAQALSRKAQAERDAEARTAEAASRQKSENARIAADKSIAEADNDLRVRKAELVREASLKEAERNRAAAEAEAARLDATEVAKANAERDIAKAKAAGDAASVYEEGKSRAAAIEEIGRAIQKNPDALKVMMVEMLPNIVKELAGTIKDVNLGDVTVIDGGTGSAMAGAATGKAKMLAESLGILEGVTGVDMRELAQSVAGSIVDKRATEHAAIPTKDDEPKQ